MMSEQADTFCTYVSTTRKLLNDIGQDHPCYSYARDYQRRLENNIEQVRLRGDTDALRAERCRIINELNKLAVREWRTSFAELCEKQVECEKKQEPPQYLQHVSNPLHAADFDHGGAVGEILENVIRARSCDDCEEVLHLCRDAVERARAYGRQPELALVYLYHADALGRNNLLDMGISLAARARQIFEMRGDRYHALVARLLLARLRAVQDADAAKLDYQEAMAYCQRIESDKKASAQLVESRLYEHIREEIQQVLDDASKLIREQYVQKYLSGSIPVLRLSDGPERISQPSTQTRFLVTGEFRIEEDTYFLSLIGEASKETLELQLSATHFALPVREDNWPNLISEEQDYALVQWEAQSNREGPAVSWTDEDREWVTGWFKRDTATGTIHVEPMTRKVRIIGQSDKHGHVVGLFKPTS